MSDIDLLLSVVIPTHKRPQFLARAIRSAIESVPDGRVEVLVVPNGPDESWKSVADEFAADSRVKWHPIEDAHANVARNHGLTLAQGKYVRFLDDDDFLFPGAAARQLEAIESKGADIASGNVTLLNANGDPFEEWSQPDTDDFCAATLGPDRKCIPLAHVYRRFALGENRWDPGVHVRQDVDWQLALCARSDWIWVKTGKSVGAWQHHWSDRVSTSRSYDRIRQATVPMLLQTQTELTANNRLGPARRRAVADGLWALVHSAFFLSPLYWSAVARIALQMDPAARPRAAIFGWPVVRRIPPCLTEWLLVPLRYAKHQIRVLLRRLHIRHYW